VHDGRGALEFYKQAFSAVRRRRRRATADVHVSSLHGGPAPVDVRVAIARSGDAVRVSDALLNAGYCAPREQLDEIDGVVEHALRGSKAYCQAFRAILTAPLRR